ncbi:AraC family transcriptional regulator [Acinetobacter gerneri]|jgi:AraC-like DNA-binding protein|uniref:HTH araC/xylS-type domain-containing protein n=1 Tax=Acinetobacter gerneri DSM 14967 = CIP 107464 = MTCC 9824 TaxID=1120926 RepID=N8ZJ51_9GAMM|nr:AraC family transcriptional regulator [Acinetobacter gerneri]ENV31768.1 hypothetical protein F960_04137 [Acinetobacter gerneri DSM 14967 = CIP 107464 = MTCC 9824]EPR84501.1 Transcriptional regulator, AraC family [Acinetobacter gerneri DSM 14967 = CIP 107464 = MTCC 9824]MCH4243521.1 AraC family transcriptional regulator [Acinetobacter gerneri]
MISLKDYTGSVYGGLGHLLFAFCQAKGLVISKKLQQVQNLERFDYSTWREILTDIDQQYQRPALGLEIAEYVEPKHLGIIAYIAMSCDSIGEALNRYYDFHRLIYDGSPLKVENNQQYLSIRWEDLPVELTTQVTNEIAIALMVQFLKRFLGFLDIQLHEVHFSHAAPKDVMIYERYFKCKVRFSQARTELFFPSSELNKPIQQGDQTLQLLLKQQAQALLEKLPNTTQLDERLQQAILKGLQTNHYQIEAIADVLNMSVRRLQKHLQSQNSTYQQRTQEVRLLLAKQYLDDPHLSLKEIALLLCYSEQSAFQRAFKLWTGMTPQQWRQDHSHYIKN